MQMQPKFASSMTPTDKAMLRNIYEDLNRMPGRFLGAFTSINAPPATTTGLAYCWIWVTTTNKPAWLDPSYPRWQYADGTAM